MCLLMVLNTQRKGGIHHLPSMPRAGLGKNYPGPPQLTRGICAVLDIIELGSEGVHIHSTTLSTPFNDIATCSMKSLTT